MPFRIKVSLAIIALLVLLVVFLPLVVRIPPPANTLSLEAAVAAVDRPDGRLLDVDGVQLYTTFTPYSGTGEAPLAFVLLHGYASNAFSFDAIREGLAAFGDVVAFDRPGFGLSSRPQPDDFRGSENPYGPEAQVRQTVDLIDRLGLERVVLVGDNSGGVLALEVALQHPELVAGLVLVATPAYLLSEGGGAPKWLLATPQLRRIGPVLMRQVAGPPGEQMYTGAWFDATKATDAQREARMIGTTVAGWDQGLWQVTLAGHPASLEGRVQQVSVPALVVAGAAAGSVPLSESERLAEELPDPTLVKLEACGDLPQEECPGQLLGLVADWLTGAGGLIAR